MPQESLSAEAVALQSIAKSLETISKSLVSLNKLLSLITFAKLWSTKVRLPDDKDKLSRDYVHGIYAWRDHVKASVSKRFAKPSR